MLSEGYSMLHASWMRILMSKWKINVFLTVTVDVVMRDLANESRLHISYFQNDQSDFDI